MKHQSLLISAACLMMATFFTTPAMAVTEQEAEEACLNQADEMQIADDKYDDFVLSCVEKMAPTGE
jgi:hypothetical protein